MRFAGYGGVKERKSLLKDFDLLSVVVQNLTSAVRMWDARDGRNHGNETLLSVDRINQKLKKRI